MKRYFVSHKSDKVVCRSNEHTYGFASTLKTAKNYISRIRKQEAEYHPRNFRIYDSYADVNPETNHVPCVYSEE